VSEAVDERLQRALQGSAPILVVLAGSNGAGKSSLHRRFLASTGLPFVNADEMAKRLQPRAESLANYEAMHVAEAVREDLLKRGESFCMETVFSDTEGAKLDFFHRAQDLGYRVLFIQIRIDSAELSQARVRQRVLAGGHDVPPDKLVSRFPRTARNARQALSFVNVGIVLDNSSFAEPYRLVEYWEKGERLE
jgi:predicted ABC-type ATPase